MLHRLAHSLLLVATLAAIFVQPAAAQVIPPTAVFVTVSGKVCAQYSSSVCTPSGSPMRALEVSLYDDSASSALLSRVVTDNTGLYAIRVSVPDGHVIRAEPGAIVPDDGGTWWASSLTFTAVKTEPSSFHAPFVRNAPFMVGQELYGYAQAQPGAFVLGAGFIVVEGVLAPELLAGEVAVAEVGLATTGGLVGGAMLGAEMAVLPGVLTSIGALAIMTLHFVNPSAFNLAVVDYNGVDGNSHTLTLAPGESASVDSLAGGKVVVESGRVAVTSAVHTDDVYVPPPDVTLPPNWQYEAQGLIVVNHTHSPAMPLDNVLYSWHYGGLPANEQIVRFGAIARGEPGGVGFSNHPNQLNFDQVIWSHGSALNGSLSYQNSANAALIDAIGSAEQGVALPGGGAIQTFGRPAVLTYPQRFLNTRETLWGTTPDVVPYQEFDLVYELAPVVIETIASPTTSVLPSAEPWTDPAADPSQLAAPVQITNVVNVSISWPRCLLDLEACLYRVFVPTRSMTTRLETMQAELQLHEPFATVAIGNNWMNQLWGFLMDDFLTVCFPMLEPELAAQGITLTRPCIAITRTWEVLGWQPLQMIYTLSTLVIAWLWIQFARTKWQELTSGN